MIPNGPCVLGGQFKFYFSMSEKKKTKLQNEGETYKQLFLFSKIDVLRFRVVFLNLFQTRTQPVFYFNFIIKLKKNRKSETV